MPDAHPKPAGQPLDTLPVTRLRGVGPKLAARLASLQIASVQDLLFHLPLRYQDRSRITAIAALRPGQDAVIAGEVRVADIVYGRRRSLMVRLQDQTGTITLRFFHFSAAQQQQLTAGSRLQCYGEARRGASGLELYHPEYRLLDGPTETDPLTRSDSLTPVYPSSEGLHQASWRKLTDQALSLLDAHPARELLPDNPFQVDLNNALRYLHRPPADADTAALQAGTHPCQQRLAFEELVAHTLSLQLLRQSVQAAGAPAFASQGELLQRFQQQLPFALTPAQQRVQAEIASDLNSRQPMLRLLQGDVGAGKTVIAAMAALQAIAAGYQVAIMAPTEILAEQHWQTFQRWLAPLEIRLCWLSGKTPAAARREALQALADGSAQLAVGTHALFQDEVQFSGLGLVIIDEQHRFGVHQRLALKQKARAELGQPHQLIMTATPIPRTLAMTAYADLDTSIIDQLPPGRTPVSTVVIDNQRRAEVIARVHRACQDGRQAYWVCTLIEESEQLSAQAAEQTWSELSAALPDLRIGLVHGRLKAADKNAVMASFKAGETQLLIATTVIEVGVDVPNASLMVIDNAERLGLSQLHQLRGRVGRGATASHCVLLYQTPLSRQGRQRLRVMRESTDGFYIAEQDLLLRGPGELLGTRQTGLAQLRIADLERDAALLPAVQATARELAASASPANRQALLQRWLPSADEYARV